MSIKYSLLGNNFQDQSLYVMIDTGQEHISFLFDCGANVLYNIDISTIQDIDHLCLSHYHIDHIAGFDSFFRHNYNREKEMIVWGPQDTLRVLSHRMQGFTWNLVQDSPGTWKVNEVDNDMIHCQTFLTKEKFSYAHETSQISFHNTLWENEYCILKAIILDHHIPCLGYLLQEKPKKNISSQLLKELSLKPGRWLQEVKDFNIPGDTIIQYENNSYTLQEIRDKILTTTEGESIAYLTDFIMNDKTKEELSQFLPKHCILCCESQYLEQDCELALKNHHLIMPQAIELAKSIEAKKIILFHFSNRYTLNMVKDEMDNLLPGIF